MSTNTLQPKLDSRLTTQPAIALGVFRIPGGLMFAMHGTAKLFGWPAGSPAALGAWPMWWAGILKVLLGGLIACGLLTRQAAFIASGTMAVAPVRDNLSRHGNVRGRAILTP